MSAAERGHDNPSDNTAISLQRADPKEGESNVRAVSLVQQIFSDPEALNLLWQVCKHCLPSPITLAWRQNCRQRR